MADPRHGFHKFVGEPDVTDEDRFRAVLGEVIGCLESQQLPYMLIGGIGSTAQGRERMTHDIDVLMRKDDAERLLDSLDELGYETQRTDPNWIYKGFRDGVILDVLFKAQGGITLDDEMYSRACMMEFQGVDLRVASAEDMLVMKAIAADEDSPRHWFDALGLISEGSIDWNYLLCRARKGPRRVLSLLLYAQADDLPVPDWVPPALWKMMHPDPAEQHQPGPGKPAAAASSGVTQPRRFIRSVPSPTEPA